MHGLLLSPESNRVQAGGMRFSLIMLALLWLSPVCRAGRLEVYHTGAAEDAQARPQTGLLLAGGGGDVDAAMQWLLRKASGGDVVVLRASGGDGYNDYLYRQPGVALNSVRSLVFHSRESALDERAAAWIRRAELIFIAGGDQSRYVRFWRDTPVQQAIQAHILAGKPIGGTSAGLAILGEHAYAALHDGDLTSELALADPGHEWITLVSDFLAVPQLRGILTDSHFSERDRLGRLLVMLGHLGAAHGGVAGLGVDERTALCIEADGAAQVMSADGGGVSLMELEPPGAEGIPPRSARVVVLGPDSRFNVRTRAFMDPVRELIVAAESGRLERFPAPAAPRGSLVIVGGALRASNDAVHEDLIRLGRLREGGRIGIIPAASGNPARSAARFGESLARRGIPAGQIVCLPLAVVDDASTPGVDESEWRHNAADPALADAVLGLDAVWFTGGDQSRITGLCFDADGQPQPLLQALTAVYRRGGLIGGTSAGAAIQSAVMILGGSSPGALRHGVADAYTSMEDQESGPLVLGRGLGFFPHGMIDQHFDRKARLGRLVVALLARPQAATHGFGIDEDTALVYDALAATAVVRGPGTVTLVDVASATQSDRRIEGVRLSVLGEGDRLEWPGPRVQVNPARKPTTGNEYLAIAAPRASGILDPYGGRLHDILGYLLADNRSADQVVSILHYPDGATRSLTFRKDARTRGFWATLDGEMDSYSVINAVLEIELMD
jgi:cyanophycinase